MRVPRWGIGGALGRPPVAPRGVAQAGVTAARPWAQAAPLLCLGGGALLLRLLRLDLPLVDFYSSREVFTAEITRNLWREGFGGFLVPHLYWQGREAGYVVFEFPLYNALVASLYALTGGVREVLGRVVSIAAWAGGAVALHALARRHFGPRVALAALALFAFAPLGVVMSRAFQPDALMLALGLVGINAFDRWLATGRAALFALAALTLSLAVLLKLPMLHLAAPLLALAIGRYGWRTPRVPALWLLAACVLLPAALWYGHAARVPEPEIPEFRGNLQPGFWFRPAVLADPHFYKALLQIELDWVLTPVGAALATLGLFLRPVPGTGFVYAWLGGVAAYFLAFNYHSMTHFYYHLPMLPAAALLVGRGWAALVEAGLGPRTFLDRRLAQVLLVVAVGIWAVRPLTYAYRAPLGLEVKTTAVLEAAKVVQVATPPDALVVAAAPGLDWILLYYADRRGWALWGPLGQVRLPHADPVRRVEDLRAMGAQYLVGVSLGGDPGSEGLPPYLRGRYRVIREGNGFILFDLQRREPGARIAGGPHGG